MIDGNFCGSNVRFANSRSRLTPLPSGVQLLETAVTPDRTVPSLASRLHGGMVTPDSSTIAKNKGRHS